MTSVSDSFARANNLSLGPNWAYLAGGGGGTAANVQILSNAVAAGPGPSSSGFATSFAGYLTQLQTPEQIITAQLASIAPSTSVVSITACTANSPSAGQATYTYTLTSGAALLVPQEVIITGMQNGGSNIPYALTISVTGTSSGTFVIANGAAVTESGSTGTGTTATDSIPLLLGRYTADGQQNYFIFFGNNSGYFSGGNDNRVWCREIWKTVAGVGTFIGGQGLLTATDSVNDIYTLALIGKKICFLRNSALYSSVDDLSLNAIGYVGCGNQSANVSGHNTPFTGQSLATVTGTSIKNWSARDAGTINPNGGWSKQVQETFNAAPNYVSNWTQQAGFPNNIASSGAGAFLGGVGVGSAAGGTSSGVWTGRSWNNNQSSSAVIYSMTGNTSLDICARMNTAASYTFYMLQVISTAGSGTTIGGGTWSLSKFVATVSTPIQSATAITINSLDCFRLECNGTTLNVYQNTTLLGTFTDSSIASGSPGILMNSNNCQFLYWSGDEFTALYSIGGNAAPAATITYSGTASGSVTADAYGNYQIPGLGVGSYTVTPSKTGVNFSPPSASLVVSTVNLTQNFSTGGGGDLGPGYDFRLRM